MKKYLLALFIACIVVPSISFASIDANLKYGARGAAVVELQNFLIQKGFLSGQASGNFFALTRKAVIAYQSSVGLSATGFVGQLTRAKINDELMAQTSASSAPVPPTANQQASAPPQTAITSPQPVINACNGTLCNGTCYNACPSGQDFICPADGGHAYCQLSQQQQQANQAAQKAQALANLEAALQSWQNQEKPIDDQITQLQNQSSQCLAQMSTTPLSEAGGQQGIEATKIAMDCQAISQALLNTLPLLNPIRNQEAYIQQQINYINSLP